MPMNGERDTGCCVNEKIRFYEMVLKEFKEGFRLIAEKIIHVSDLMDQRFGDLGHNDDGIVKLKKALGIKS